MKGELNKLAVVMNKVQQSQNIFAISATKMFENVLTSTKIVSPERAKEIVPQFYDIMSSVFSKYAANIQPLKEGQQVGAGLPTVGQIYSELEKKFEQMIGKKITELPKPEQSVIENLLMSLAGTLSEQLRANQILKTGIAEALQQLQPQLAWKQIQESFYKKPVELQPIESVSDIQRYVQQVQRALSDLVESFRTVANEIKTDFSYVGRGMVSYGSYQKWIEKWYTQLDKLLSTETGQKILSSPQIFKYVAQSMTPEQIAMVSNDKLRESLFRHLYAGDFEKVYNLYKEREFALLKPGFQVLETAHPVRDVNLTEIINTKVNQLANGLDVAGKELVNALKDAAVKITEVTKTLQNISTSNYGKLTNEDTLNIQSQIESNKPPTLPKPELDTSNGILGILKSGAELAWEGLKSTFMSIVNLITEPPGMNLPEPNLNKLKVEESTKLSDVQQPQSVNITITNANINGVSQVHINGH
jgi:hypothetical protein